jgi:hypothetical protein
MVASPWTSTWLLRRIRPLLACKERATCPLSTVFHLLGVGTFHRCGLNAWWIILCKRRLFPILY